MEHIIYFENTWIRFFIHPRYGLCTSKMENSRFSRFEILLSDIEGDFSAALCGGKIQLVCQDKNGCIILLTYDGNPWQKTELLKSRSLKPHAKFFTLVPMGSLVNLFYVINHDNKTMLIHQILDGTSKSPEAVDYIQPVGIRYFVATGITSDINLMYRNENGVLGSRVYRWSHKSFMPFIPFPSGGNALTPFVYIDADKTLFCAPPADNTALTLFLKNDAGELLKKQLSDFCSANSNPVIFVNKEKTIVQWCDNGCIMSSVSYDGGISFTKPVKYLKNAMQNICLFKADNGKNTAYCYGYSAENNVTFYTVPNFLSIMQNNLKSSSAKILKKGQEAEDFAKSLGFKKSIIPEDDPYVTKKELLEEIKKLNEKINNIKKEQPNGTI